MKYTVGILGLILAITTVSTPAAEQETPKLPAPSDQKDVSFAKEIKPLFEASCVQCHGNQRPKGGLRLDSLEAVLKGGEHGKVLTPGDSAKSKLVLAVARLDPRTAMPPTPRQGGRRGPGGAGGPPQGQGGESPAGAPGGRPAPKPLTAEQVSLIRAWVDQGAK